MSLKRLPKLRLHKSSSTFWAAIGGRDCWYTRDEDESSRRHDRLIAEWLANGRHWPPSVDAHVVSVTELCVRYLDFAKTYYVKNGKPTAEVAGIRVALRTVRRLYGPEPVAKFGPLMLKAARQVWIDEGTQPTEKPKGKPRPIKGNCRGFVNKKTDLVRRMFRWGVAEELVPPSVIHGLAAVAGLRKGRSEAIERPPVPPVDWKDVRATLPHAPPPVAAMVRLQALTGMRPGEVVQMRMCDLQRDDVVWTYIPESHKTEHHGHQRAISLDPTAQKILAAFFKADPDAHLFSPRDAEEKRNATRRASRKTPMTPSQRARTRNSRRKRKPKECYSTDSYRRAITRACRKAGIAPWNPNRLRHSHATDVRRDLGLEAAQVVLGHAKANTTQIYAERNLALARRVAVEIAPKIAKEIG